MNTKNLSETLKIKYFLNDISQHFYVPLRLVEVALRNRVNEVISRTFGAEWYDAIPLSATSQKLVAQAKSLAVKEVTSREIVPDDIVCRLMFGFWVFMLDKPYRNTTDSTRHIWTPTTFKAAFPGVGTGLSIATVMDRLKSLNGLRNRLFHHEPIWKNSRVKSVEDAVAVLNAHYSDLCEVLKWLSPEQNALVHAWGFPGRFMKSCTIDRFDRQLW